MNDVAGQCRILAAFGKAKKAAQGTLICANGERSRHGRSKDPRGWQWGKLRIACRHVNSGQPKEKTHDCCNPDDRKIAGIQFPKLDQGKPAPAQAAGGEQESL
jgi:hypothetical protein